MGLKAAVQALKKAEPLKDKVQRCKDLLNDNDAWVCQQQLQKIYQQVLILDLEYALDKKVEQELWSLGFKNYIVTLQSQAKDKKNPKRGESQALLSWCLEAASGFYLTLLQEICTVFDLDLPFRRKGYVYGCTSPWKAVEKLSPPHKSSCFYACQYCLVHLGDIARYRNESKQAEMFYRHAVSLSPSSGQPYNQLALLEASRGDKLGTVFHYARSVAVKHPFPVATANLATTLSSALNDKSFNIDGKTKLNSQEYIAVFLKLHGIIHILGDLKLACSYSKQLTETLTALVATESFSSWMLIQMLVINLYALQHTAGIGTESTELLKNEQMVNDKRLARDCILDLIAGTLSALLLPVYTIKNSIIEYFALPSIKLCLDWINIKPMVLEEVAFTSRLQIWPSLCVLLNALQNCVVDFKYAEYAAVPLPEDRDLQGFLPLEKSFENLRFTNTALEGDVTTLNKLRAIRILHLGHCFAQYQINGSTPISIMTEEKTGDNRFTSMSNGAGPSNELMKELEELSLNKDKQLDTSTSSPVLSEVASSKSSVETDIEIPSDKKIFQGILKPQGSLERNRDSLVNTAETSSSGETNSLPCARKPRQNIAMQAIMRRAENEQKQVTFKNVSPVVVEEENDKKAKVLTVPPVTSVANKPTPIPEMPKANEAANTNNILVNVQNRLSAMPIAPPTGQNQSASSQSQQRPAKLPLSIPMPAQVNQLTAKEQQQPQQVTQQMLPQMHTGMTTQCSQQASTLGPLCYPNQSFNVQSPQFGKNFMANHPPLANAPRYQMQGQLNNNSQPVPAISQGINGMHHAINQSRPLHQRMSQNVSHSSAQLLQQNIRLGSPAQQNMMPQNMSLQANNMGLQPGMSIEQQNHSIGLQQQQQSMMQSNPRPNDMHGQLNMNGSSMANMTMMSALSIYEKDPQQQTLTTLANSQSPTNTSNFQLNFNHFNQNQTFGQSLSQSQPSPSFYKNSDAMDFSFPNQMTKNQQQQQPAANNYMFCNYEPTEQFNLWKDSRPPQPPIAWWAGSVSNATAQIHMKDSTTNDNTFSNWSDSSNLGSTTSRMPLTPGKNYQPQQNEQHSRQLMAGNNFEDSRLFELEQKPSQAVSTGNTYSLFSGNTWSTVNTSINSGSTNQDPMKTRLHQQSLWSGPGPSPLERLLKQQKSLREGGTT